MPIFQKSVVNKYLNTLDPGITSKKYQVFRAHYTPEKIENIKITREEQYQEGFLREVFVDCLGYTINPDPEYNLTTEFKNLTDSKKADGAILKDGKALAVIELKSTQTSDLEKIKTQAFNYKNNQPECKFVITSNFWYIRFYIDNATEFEEFNLFELTEEDFRKLYLFLSRGSIFNEIPSRLKEESRLHEEVISDKLYRDYSRFKYDVFNDLVKNNPQYEKLILFHKSQKLLDRFLFVLFAEDSGLVPPNCMTRIIDQWKTFEDMDESVSLYSRFQKFFHHLNVGHKYKTYDLPEYDGGLFADDEILDKVIIDDEVLVENTLKLSTYDFSTDIDVNILGQIFEHSISEIEEKTAELEGTLVERQKARRKKEGIYYTPKYITKYIVDNTVGRLCDEKKKELNLDYIDPDVLISPRTKSGNLSRKAKDLFERLESYREYLLSLKILDPACGSGAFLNQALEFLIREHNFIEEYLSQITEDRLGLFAIKKSILENNLFGVDINEESVEIAKLSLWLRTAEKGRKLSFLSNNIKCGNSLIDDPEVAGNKAFKWEEEFPEIFKKGGFDVVIGNPPYVRQELFSFIKPYLKKNYFCYNSIADLYTYFIEKGIKLTKIKGCFSFILPNKFLRSKYGKETREYIYNNISINLIYDFDDYDVFHDSTTYPIIFVFDKTKKNKKNFFFYSSINKRIITTDPISTLKNNEIIVSNEELNNDYWNFINIKTKSVLKKIISNSFPLKEIVEDKIFRGVSTGRNDVFIINDNTKLQFGEKINDFRIRKIVMGKEVKRYRLDFQNLYLLFIPWEYDINENPLIKEYLLLHKSDLESRPEVKEGKLNWWCLSRYGSKNAKYLFQPKIIYPRINNRCNFYLDEFGEYSLSDNNFYISSESKELLGILNSKLCFFYLKNISSTLRGGYYDFRRPYIESVPIYNKLFDLKQNFNNLVNDQILNFKEQQKIENYLIKIIKDKYSLKNVSSNLYSWYKLSIENFLNELKESNINLKLSEELEWIDFFEKQKEKLQNLNVEIDKVDTLINQMVYEFYELTEEEIKIIEESIS